LSPFVDVSDDRALVAAPGKAHLVDVKSGKSLQSAPFVGTQVHALGLIDQRRAFVHTASAVAILDLESGSTLSTIDLGGKSAPGARSFGARNACQRVGKHLYVSSDSSNALFIIDLEARKVIDQIKVPEWRIGSVSVRGDKATVIGLRYGYGIWTNSIAEIDLKTKKYTPMKMVTSALQPCQIVRGADDTLFLSAGHQAHRYEANGTLTPVLAKENAGRLVGVWNGQGVVVCGSPRGTQELRILPLPAATARAAR
jgi:YVTN family beta-propeller protein